MALNPSTPAHAIASHSAASALFGARSGAKPRVAAPDEDDGGFAAQLLKAQPAPDADAKPAEAKSDASADKKSDKDDDGDKTADASAAAKTPDAAPQPVDPNALVPAWQALPPATLSLGKTAVDPADAAADALGALRKAGKGGKEAAIAALGVGKDATAAASTPALTGKGSKSATDPTAALDKAGAANAATDTKDSLAALLPQPDPVTVQAGAIGASPNAVQDPNAGATAPTAPAQAALPMLPQHPAFAPALGQQIEVWMRDGVQHAEVQLSPQDLGPIRVKIEMEGAQARVQMSADVQSTRDALQQALPQLSDSLGQVGLSLSGGGVSDQSTAQSQAQAQADAQGGAGGAGGRSGGGARSRGDVDDGGDELIAASAVRQAAQRRGLLDMYA